MVPVTEEASAAFIPKQKTKPHALKAKIEGLTTLSELADSTFTEKRNNCIPSVKIKYIIDF